MSLSILIVFWTMLFVLGSRLLAFTSTSNLYYVRCRNPDLSMFVHQRNRVLDGTWEATWTCVPHDRVGGRMMNRVNFFFEL